MLNLGSLCSFQTIQNPLMAKRPSTCQRKASHEPSEWNSEPSRGEGAQGRVKCKEHSEGGCKTKPISRSQAFPPAHLTPPRPLCQVYRKDPEKEANLDPPPPDGSPSANTQYLHILLPCPLRFSHPALWNPSVWGGAQLWWLDSTLWNWLIAPLTLLLGQREIPTVACRVL